nr:hypothetical protein Itr_chr06CG13950 [Ipomoea trifida]
MVKTGRMLSRAATLPRRVVVAAGTGRRKRRRGKLSHVHHTTVHRRRRPSSSDLPWPPLCFIVDKGGRKAADRVLLRMPRTEGESTPCLHFMRFLRRRGREWNDGEQRPPLLLAVASRQRGEDDDRRRTEPVGRSLPSRRRRPSCVVVVRCRLSRRATFPFWART